MSNQLQDAFISAMGGANGRVVQLPHPCIVFLAQNLDGRAALLAKLDLGPDTVIPDGKGFTVTTIRGSSGRFVRLTSNEPGASLLFIKLADYILQRTEPAQSSEEASALLVAAIVEFKRFFQRKPGRLQEDQIRGLVAELKFMSFLLETYKDRTRDIFYSWGGPFEALHDFSFSDGKAVEVKSAHRPVSEIRVSSNDQIQPIEEGLDLVVLPLERVAPGVEADISFVELVNHVGAHAANCGPDVSELWEKALVALRLDIEDEFYEQWKFMCGEWIRFEVDSTFPSIDKAIIPRGIVKISYALRTEELKDFQAEFSGLRVPL